MILEHEIQRSPEEVAALELLARRVANAPQLHGSPKLREFLFYVVDCALREAPEEATEQQIGVHVFHRRPGYNSGDDSIVRSQARLLRAKLTTYFAGEGLHEPVIIEIPKGQYLPVFRHAAESGGAATPPTVELPMPQPIAAQGGSELTTDEYPKPRPAEDHAHARARWLRAAIVCALGTFLLGIAVGSLWRERKDYPPTPALDAFWLPFYTSNNALVIYSNPAFSGDPSTGLRLLQASPADAIAGANEPIDETYTGTGEAAAIHDLTRLFDVHGATFTLKRSRLVTWDEARSRSLIFVGAPSQNTALNDLQTLTQFHIAETPGHRGYIVNVHPNTGEPVSFPMQTPADETAIVALLPGLQPDTRIAIFSGLSTVGTQEAVEFLSEPETARILASRLGTINGTIKPFEAVLNIKTSKGVAMGASFLTIHSH